jgi:predicted signal transduction protein with EAL and GGDEF domain
MTEQTKTDAAFDAAAKRWFEIQAREEAARKSKEDAERVSSMTANEFAAWSAGLCAIGDARERARLEAEAKAARELGAKLRGW